MQPAAALHILWWVTERASGQPAGRRPPNGISSPAAVMGRCLARHLVHLTVSHAQMKHQTVPQVRYWDIRQSGCLHCFDQHDTKKCAMQGSRGGDGKACPSKTGTWAACAGRLMGQQPMQALLRLSPQLRMMAV